MRLKSHDPEKSGLFFLRVVCMYLRKDHVGEDWVGCALKGMAESSDSLTIPIGGGR